MVYCIMSLVVKKYEFYYGSGIYIPYVVYDIEKIGENKEDWIITLTTADTYAGASKVIVIKYKFIMNKKKIYDWVDNQEKDC